jgi:hypothetical protein
VQQALNQVQSNVSGRFAGENYGGSANQEWLGKQLAGTALPIYAQQYQNERQNQLNALSMAPGLQQANLQQLLGAGALQENRGQQEIGAAQQQFYAPWDVLGRYAQVLGQIQTPNSGTTSVPYYTNPTANLLGGALGGAQLGSQIGSWFGSPNAFGGANASGWGTGAAYGNQDYGLYL